MHERAHCELEQLCDVQAAYLLSTDCGTVSRCASFIFCGPSGLPSRSRAACSIGTMRGCVACYSTCSSTRRPRLSDVLSLWLLWGLLMRRLGARRSAARVRVASVSSARRCDGRRQRWRVPMIACRSLRAMRRRIASLPTLRPRHFPTLRRSQASGARGSSRAGAGQGAAAGAQRRASGAATSKANMQCWRCGKFGHSKSECTARCNHCGLQVCGGVRDAAGCMVKNGFPKDISRMGPETKAKIEAKAKEMQMPWIRGAASANVARKAPCAL